MNRKRKGGSAVPAVGDEERIMIKTQSLLQDYEELFVDTEDEMIRLEKMKRRKSRLLAEVKFLRNKYQSFVTKKFEEFGQLKCQDVDTKHTGPSKPPHQSLRKESTLHLTIDSNSKPNSTLKKNKLFKENAIGLIDLNQSASPDGEEMENTPENPLEEADLTVDNVKALVSKEDDGKKVGATAATTRKRKISWQDPIAVLVGN